MINRTIMHRLSSLLTVLLLAGFGTSLSAQVSGISYTISPSAQYVFWDEMAGLSDGLLAGGHVGIGFGENVELRGMYLFDLGLTNDFGDFPGLSNLGQLTERDVNLTRYGGEVRLNLGRSSLLPFLTLGAGVQELELDGGAANEHVYASAGLGITLSIADRFTLKVEGKNTAYNFNAVNGLLTAADRDAIGVAATDFASDRLYNWSVGAGLTVYLGGRRPGTLTAVDQAYAEAFGNGFSNVSVLVEPTVSRINFDDVLPYKDMYLGGAALGIDFGPLVGFRGYYLKGMEDDELSLTFDDIAVWGADFRFRFSSTTTGLSPFVSLGGGYIDTQDEYEGRGGARGAASQAFAAGGLGASINLSPNFRLLGTYKWLLTTGTEVEELQSTDQIVTSNQWGLGLNLAFGKRARRPEAMFSSVAQDQMRREQARLNLEKQAALAEQARKNAAATRQLKNDYEVRIYTLNEELEAARNARDTALVAQLEEQVEATEELVAELETREADLDKTAAEADTERNFLEAELNEEVNAPTPTFATPTPARGGFFGSNGNNTRVESQAAGAGRIVLTPAEFEGLIEEIFEGLNYGMPAPPPGGMRPGEEVYELEYDVEMTEDGPRRMMRPAPADTARINQMERQLADLRTAVENLTRQQEDLRELRAEDKAQLRDEMRQSTEDILREIRAMREELANKAEMSKKEKRRQEKGNN